MALTVFYCSIGMMALHSLGNWIILVFVFFFICYIAGLDGFSALLSYICVLCPFLLHAVIWFCLCSFQVKWFPMHVCAFSDFGVDWWALGVLLFEMLVGRSPFDIVGQTDNPDQNSEDFLFQGLSFLLIMMRSVEGCSGLVLGFLRCSWRMVGSNLTLDAV